MRGAILIERSEMRLKKKMEMSHFVQFESGGGFPLKAYRKKPEVKFMESHK